MIDTAAPLATYRAALVHLETRRALYEEAEAALRVIHSDLAAARNAVAAARVALDAALVGAAP